MEDKRFDVTVKDMIEDDGKAWAQRFSGHLVQKAEAVDADVSTITAAADKVLRVQYDRGVCLLNIEPESRHAADAPDRMLLYGTVLRHRHDLPVRSVLLLLRREANATTVTGTVDVFETEDDEEPYLIFRYHVVRLWLEPMEPLLTGGLGTMPLAALTDEAATNLSGVVHRIDQRLRQEAPPEFADKMRTATYLLLGLRYAENVIDQLFREIANMEDSTTYQAILARGEERGEARGEARGRLTEAHHCLLRLGRRKFGEPDAATLTTLQGISGLERLEELTERLLDASSWQELLAGP